MDTTPDSVGDKQSPVLLPKNTYLKILLGILALLVVGLMGIFTVPKVTQKDIMSESATTTIPIEVQSGWKTYENREIGIAFEYPASWGEVTATRAEGWCSSTDSGYYSPAQLEQKKKDVAASPNDPCISLALHFGDGPTFLSTITPLASKYPMPRDGYWGDMAGGVVSDEYIANYCSTVKVGECNMIANTHGVNIIHYQGIIGMGDENGEVYLAHTPNPLYYGLALSPSRLPADIQQEFSKVVDSLIFIKVGLHPSESFLSLLNPEQGMGLNEKQLAIVSDPATFTSADYYMKTAGGFYRDKDHVYWVVFAEPVYDLQSSIRIVPDMDGATLKGVDFGTDAQMFAVDKNHVYCEAFPIPGFNPKTVRFSTEFYAVDQGRIWGGVEGVELHDIPNMTLQTACHEYTRTDFKSDVAYQNFLAEVTNSLIK